MTVELPYRFEPRDYQGEVMRAIIKRGIKRAVCVWHRRAGKDKTFLNIMAIMAMKKMGNYAYYFPTATLGRKALWDNIDANSGMRVIDHLPPELVAKVNEQQMKITLVNKSTIQILGTETLDVVGGNHIGVVFSEAAQHRPDAWDYVRPILAENGGWALFNGTPRGKNWFYRLKDQAQQNPDWFCQVLTVDDTGAITSAGIQAERDAKMSEDMIRQEFYCDFNAANPGAIYAKAVEDAKNEGRIVERLPVANTLVHTSWDLGSPLNMPCWFWQVVGREIHVIDYDVGRLGETLVQRVARIMQKGYPLGTHYLPHDAQQTERTGRTFVGEMREAGFANIRVVPVTTDVWIGINALLALFPSLVFLEPKTRLGLDALEAFHTREVNAGCVISNLPVHDWSSHPCDALRTMAEAHLAGMIKTGLALRQKLDDPEWFGERRKPRVIAGFRG